MPVNSNATFSADADARRLALEVIATLCNVKKTCAELALRRADSIKVMRPFRRNERGEQIDAAFEMDGWHYIVECRWRDSLADIRQLDGLAGQVRRSGRQTMGLFLSINGWSKHVVPLLKQNPDKSIFLMEGYDLRCVLDLRADLRELLKDKLSALSLDSEPYFSVTRLLG